MRPHLDEKSVVNTIQTYNFDDSMKIMRNSKCIELGISSLYTFENKYSGYTVASDACADIMIYHDGNKSNIGVDIVGPHDNLDFLELHGGCTYFGIRFLPGYSPISLRDDIKSIKGSVMSVDSGELYNALVHAVCGKDSFTGQCSAVLRCMDSLHNADILRTGSPLELAQWIMNVIINDRKKHSLAELAEASGYSARYLNKVFSAYTGYSIARFSNIMRAQRVGGYLCACKKNGITPDYSYIACQMSGPVSPHLRKACAYRLSMVYPWRHLTNSKP